MNIQPIRTAADHAAALKELERIWDKARPGTPAGDKFEVLSAMVDAYERAAVVAVGPGAGGWRLWDVDAMNTRRNSVLTTFPPVT